jgi:hypothetical protein
MSISLILTVAAFLILLLILWYATKFLIRIVIFLLILFVGIGYLYINEIGPFNHDDIKIKSLKELYCNDNGDEDICNCIVEVIENHSDILIEINPNDKYVLPKSILNSYDESLTCLKLKNAEPKYKEFLLEISNYEKITISDSIKHKAHHVGEQILEKFK